MFQKVRLQKQQFSFPVSDQLPYGTVHFLRELFCGSRPSKFNIADILVGAPGDIRYFAEGDMVPAAQPV